MDQLRAMKYFASVVDTGSFTLSAKHFSVPPSSVSRRISDLETALGAVLLKRSTRVVSLTEVGQLYHQEVSKMLQLLSESEEVVRTYQAKPMGQLKISSMTSFGESILLPLMDEFSTTYPDVILDISLSDSRSTLGKDDVDLAIRGGYAPNERVVAVKLMENDFYPFAAPAYLEACGTPKHPEDLLKHKGIYYKTPDGPTQWLSDFSGHWQNVSPKAVMIANEGKWIIQQAVQGKGIVMLPRWVVQPQVDKRELVEIDIQPPVTVSQNGGMGVYMLYQKHKYHVPKIKAAVDFLKSKIGS